MNFAGLSVWEMCIRDRTEAIEVPEPSEPEEAEPETEGFIDRVERLFEGWWK